MSQLRILVTYHRQDEAYCRALVNALQQAGADVVTSRDDGWYEDATWGDTDDAWDTSDGARGGIQSLGSYVETNTAGLEYDADDSWDNRWDDESEQWNETIASSYELASTSYDEITRRWDEEDDAIYSTYWVPYTPRSVFVVLLSEVALASRSFKETISSYHESLASFPTDILLAVTAGPIAESDFNANYGWRFLSGVMRIEAPDIQPLPLEEAARRTVEALSLSPAGATPVPTQSVQDLLMRGNALFAQGRYTEAVAFFEQATHRAPQWFPAWFNLGRTLFRLKRWSAVVTATERATRLDPTFAATWTNLGGALNQLQRCEEGLAACERALALEPHNAIAWSNTGSALCSLTRYDEALAACNQALLFDPTYAGAWNNKGVVLNFLKRYDEALDAVNRALTLDRTKAEFWDTKGEVLHGLHRDEEALRCFDRAITLEPGDGYYWKTKAMSLRALGSTAEAEAAERRAKELGG